MHENSSCIGNPGPASDVGMLVQHAAHRALLCNIENIMCLVGTWQQWYLH